MTGAWKGGHAFSNATDIGAVTASTSTVQLLGDGATTYAKGAWVEMTASTSTDIAWINFVGQTHNSAGIAFAVDIGIGAAASEIVVVNNLCFSATTSAGQVFLFPFMVAAGTRIAARMSSSSVSDAMYVKIEAYQDLFASSGLGCAVDTYGFSNATNLGTSVDPGAAANTKGAYSQITASVTNDLAGFMLVIDSQSDTTGVVGNVSWLIDVAVGANGSEVVILPNLYQNATSSSGVLFYIPLAIYRPIQIRSGTRIAIRAQCSTATSPDRTIGFTVYGIRQ